MKLLECYIENFGTLHQFSYHFESGLNVICKENGWGKTTLAAFIKAMFYGLDYTTKRSLDENERKRYEPWQGGSFGGNVTFEMDGNHYRLERFFTQKDKTDVFQCYDVATGLPCNRFGECPGETIFGIDKTSFEKSIFLRQENKTVGLTDGIASKLSGLMASGDDMDCFERACISLENEKKIYQKIGDKGKIPEIKTDIAKLQDKIAKAKQLEEALVSWNYKLDEKKEQEVCFEETRENIKKKIAMAIEKKETEEKKKQYLKMQEKLAEIKNQMASLEVVFHGNIPSESTLEQIKQKIFERKRLEGEKTKITLTASQYPLLSQMVKERPISEGELRACESRLDKISQEAEGCNEQIIQLSSKQLQEGNQIQIVSAAAQRKRNAALLTIANLVITLILLFCGFYLLFLQKNVFLTMVPWIGFLIITVINAVIWIKNRKKLGLERNTLQIMREEREKTETQIKRITSQIEAGQKAVQTFLNPYLMEESLSQRELIARLRQVNAEQRNMEQLIEKQRIQNEKEQEEKGKIKQEIEMLLSSYYIPNDLEQNDFERWENVLHRLERALLQYHNLESEWSSRRQEMEAFPKRDWEKEDANEYATVESLQQQEEIVNRNLLMLRDEMNIIKQKIEEYMEQIAACEQDEVELGYLQEELEESVQKYQRLNETLRYLKTAKEQFSGRYLQKMNSGFQKYAKLFSDSLLENTDLDVKLCAKTEQFGLKRDISYLSLGSKEAVELCTRFSLIEALFEQETPFVILDDPFVNLDEKKLDGAKTILKSIANKYQIIYFVCHSSRK